MGRASFMQRGSCTAPWTTEERTISMELGLIESVMLTMLVALAGTALLGWRLGNDRRDVGLLTALATLWGLSLIHI